jgi:ribosomal protein S12 methylthiotransferase accessory factor
VQCLSEIFERAVKREILEGEIALPDVPQDVLANTRHRGRHRAGRAGLPGAGQGCVAGRRVPVMCVTLMNPRTGGVFASFGAHPSLEVALERSLTELLQGRSFEGLNDLPQPTFESNAVTEPNNFVEHFIDSSGVVSWRFFSAKADYEFVEWDFSGHGETPTPGSRHAVRHPRGHGQGSVHGGVRPAGRHRLPHPGAGYSEIYPVEDLIWDNTNKALLFRADILNLHRLDDEALAAAQRLENSELDDYTDITTLIGIEFDENTAWGQLTILKLKLLINLAQQFEEAQELVGAFLQYNDNTVERGLFYQALNVVLEVVLDDELELDDYEPTSAACSATRAWTRCWARWTAACASGLTPTSMKLEGWTATALESYRKLHKARALFAQAFCISGLMQLHVR